MFRAALTAALVTLSSVCLAQSDKAKSDKAKQIELLAEEFGGDVRTLHFRTFGPAMTVDILTKDLAILVVATPKEWPAAVGNALHGAAVGKRLPCVILLRKEGATDDVQYLDCQARLETTCRLAGVRMLMRDTEKNKTYVYHDGEDKENAVKLLKLEAEVARLRKQVAELQSAAGKKVGD